MKVYDFQKPDSQTPPGFFDVAVMARADAVWNEIIYRLIASNPQFRATYRNMMLSGEGKGPH